MKRALLTAAALLLASCAATTGEPFAALPADGPVWPAAPESPRVQYVASVTRHQDLFRETGFGRAVARVFGGDVDSRLSRPCAVAVHRDGLLVADPGRACVHFFDWEHGRYTAIGEGLDGGLPSPVGVAAMEDGSILVSDSRRNSVERFAPGGRHLGAFGPADIRRPAGVAVDSINHRTLIADVPAHAIRVLDADGAQVAVLGRNGAGAGEFNFPTHLAITGAGEVLVADSMNFRVQRLAADGAPLSAYGRPGDSRGDFARPKGVADAGGGVFIAVEGLYDSLVFFNAEGSLLMTMGGAGNAPGQFWLPAGIAVDRERRLLYVADSYNSRVQVFRLLPAEAPAGEATP